MFSNHLHALAPRTRISNIEWGERGDGSGGNTPTIALIFFSLPFFSFLSFSSFLPFFLSRFIDSFLWIQGRKINLELLIGEGGRSIHFRDSLLTDLRSTRGSICNEHRWTKREEGGEEEEEEEEKNER